MCAHKFILIKLYSYKCSSVAYSLLTQDSSLLYTIHFITTNVVLDMSACYQTCSIQNTHKFVTRATLLPCCNATKKLVPDEPTRLGYIINVVQQSMCRSLNEPCQ